MPLQYVVTAGAAVTALCPRSRLTNPLPITGTRRNARLPRRPQPSYDWQPYDWTVVVPGRSLPQYGWDETATKPLLVARMYQPHCCASSWPKAVE